MKKNVINEGIFTMFSAGPVMAPYEYTGYKDEILASKKTAYLGTALNESPIYEVNGPDADKFLTSICVVPKSPDTHIIKSISGMRTKM